MSFQKGHQKLGGRSKNSPNKRTVLSNRLREQFDKCGFNLEERIAQELQKEDPYVELVEAMIKLLPYLVVRYKEQDPPPEPIEVIGTALPSQTTQELLEAVEEPTEAPGAVKP